MHGYVTRSPNCPSARQTPISKICCHSTAPLKKTCQLTTTAADGRTLRINHAVHMIRAGARRHATPRPAARAACAVKCALTLEPRLRELHERVHRGAYRPQPSRRTYIPKADGKQRPLAIAALEDKIVQGATVMVLNAIYEGDFVGFSYGFRPGRGHTMRWTP